jgi:hypothetical protein
MYNILKISDSTVQQCLTLELVSAVWCEEHAVVQVLVDRNVSVRKVYKCLCRVYGIDMLTGIVGHWVEIVIPSKTGETEHHDFTGTEI